METKKEKTPSALTPLVIRFVDNHLKMGEVNAAQAMRDAGYKEGASDKSVGNYASEVLQKPDVVAYIAKRRKEIADAAEVTPEWVISFAKEYAEKHKDGVPILDKYGEEVGRKSDSAAVIGALGIITKVCGMDKQTIEHDVRGGGKNGFGIILHMDGDKPEKKEGNETLLRGKDSAEVPQV